MQQVNNMRAALEAKRKEALEEAGVQETEQPILPTPETPRDEQMTPRTRVRRLSIGVANFVRQLSDGEKGTLAQRSELQSLYREPINLQDKPPSDHDVDKCLNLLRDAHQLWRQLSKSSIDSLSKREGFKTMAVEEQL